MIAMAETWWVEGLPFSCIQFGVFYRSQGDQLVHVVCTITILSKIRKNGGKYLPWKLMQCLDVQMRLHG